MRGASVYARKGSPYWQCSYFCVERMKRVHEPTAWRIDDPTAKRRAMQFASAKAAAAAAFRGHAKLETWVAWVPRFIEEKYRNSPLSLKRAQGAWSWIALYLHEKQVHLPAAVAYNHVIGFVDWRCAQKRHCGKTISRNTAITDVKFLGVVMREAVRRGFANSNPCERAGLRRDPLKEKPELTDSEIASIRAECARTEAHLPIAEQWMTTSFEIALHTLCRLRSTQVPMERVDFDRQEITLRVKGRKNGEPSYLTVPIHPALLPRLHAIAATKAAFTCVLPRMAAKQWWLLRKRINITHTCFHSTRVTGITRLWRNGVPESAVMRLAGHKSPTVHRIYQRGTTRDLAKHLDLLQFSPEPPPTPATPQTPGEHPTKQ